MLQYRANKYVFKSLRKLSLVTLGSLKLSGNVFQADGPATEKQTGVVDWQTWDAAEKRRRRLVGRGRPSTAALDLVGNCAPWCRACTWLAQARWASAVQCTVTVTSLGRTCVCQWSHEQQHSSLVEACQSSLSAHPPEERCSSQRVTTQMSGQVSLLTACRVNAGNAAAVEASRNLRRWRWRRVCRG